MKTKRVFGILVGGWMVVMLFVSNGGGGGGDGFASVTPPAQSLTGTYDLTGFKEGKRQIKIKISWQSDNLSSQQHTTSKPICPISCFADSKGWKVDFECEEKPQMVRKTYHKGYWTSFLNGKPHSQGDVEFKYEKSGNNYLVTVKTWPCVESSTGYCIELKATGGALGNNLSTCRNFK